MALKQYNGRFCEQDFENALISMFEAVNWHYLFGDDIQRSGGTEVLILDDLRNFLAQENPFLTPDEVADLVNRISLVGAESDFAFHACLRDRNDDCHGIPFQENI